MRTLISLKGASWRDRLLSAKLGRRAPVFVLDHFPTSCADLLPVKVETVVGKAAVGRRAISLRCSLGREVRAVLPKSSRT